MLPIELLPDGRTSKRREEAKLAIAPGLICALTPRFTGVAAASLVSMRR
jgi:hypothetical protein